MRAKRRMLCGEPSRWMLRIGGPTSSLGDVRPDSLGVLGGFVANGEWGDGRHPGSCASKVYGARVLLSGSVEYVFGAGEEEWRV